MSKINVLLLPVKFDKRLFKLRERLGIDIITELGIIIKSTEKAYLSTIGDGDLGFIITADTKNVVLPEQCFMYVPEEIALIYGLCVLNYSRLIREEDW